VESICTEANRRRFEKALRVRFPLLDCAVSITTWDGWRRFSVSTAKETTSQSRAQYETLLSLTHSFENPEGVDGLIERLSAAEAVHA